MNIILMFVASAKKGFISGWYAAYVSTWTESVGKETK